MLFRPLAGCAAFACLSVSALAQSRLNDTGVVTCYSAVAATGVVSVATPDPEAAGFNEQDCTRGAAATDALGRMPKVGASATKGRDYTKIANNGGELSASALLGTGPGDWACTRDNVTGLLWEIKTADTGLRGKDNRYTWFNTDGSVNGGDAGVDSNAARCNDGDTTTHCDTTDYIAAVDAQGLCGVADWRLPSKRELQSIVDYGAAASPRLDSTWFPNTASSAYWTGTNYAVSAPNEVWVVLFDGSGIRAYAKFNAVALRLVTAAPTSTPATTMETNP